MEDTTKLHPYLQIKVDNGISALDILHGHMKVLMAEAEQEYLRAEEAEEESGEAIDSMERKYWEGICEAYEHIYILTYQLSFAEAEREKNAAV